MSEGLLGEIKMFAGDFAPRGWEFCNGQLLSISEYSALYSLLGTRYGGDGRNTFALPDLRGRVPVHPGTGPGLTTRQLAQEGGTETHTLHVHEMPAHAHTVRASSTPGDQPSPEGNVWAASDASGGQPTLRVRTSITIDARQGAYTRREPNVTMGDGAIAEAGGNQAHNNMPPFLGIHYIIATLGYFPSRS